MKRKSLKFTVTVIFMIFLMMLSYFYTLARVFAIDGLEADNETSLNAPSTDLENINEEITVNSEEELKKFSLLGTTSERALEEEPGLGIAKYFSLFCEGNAKFTGADTEGRVAVGGGIDATGAGYKYQIGCENSDKYIADVIVGNGPVKNIAVNYGYTDDGQSQTKDNKIIAYSSNATAMNLGDYTEEEQAQFIKADLIDFNSEFKRLREYSQKLYNEKKDGTVPKGGCIVGKINHTRSNQEFPAASKEMYVLTGDNPDVNIFTISKGMLSGALQHDKYVKEMVNRKELGSIAFNVPYGSKVVLNITDADAVNIDFGYIWNLYYPLSEEKLAELNVDDNKIGYITTGQATKDENRAEYIEDEDGNVKPFIKVVGGKGDTGNKEDLVDKILINLPNAKNVTLKEPVVSILAPNADVKAEEGYLYGNLICKSYEGKLQLGSFPNNVLRKYRINIDKIDEELKTNIKGARFEVLDEQGNLVTAWTSDGKEKAIDLDVGTYTLKETSAPTSYEIMNDFIFTVNIDGSIYDVNGNKIAIADIIFNEKQQTKTYTDKSANWNGKDGNEFPYTWDILYEGLDKNVGNISRVSFEIDPSSNVDSTYMVVAENNGKIVDKDTMSLDRIVSRESTV